MKYFSIRTNKQETIKDILDNKNKIEFDDLSWHYNDISINDIIFMVISGDESKKEYKYKNGLRGIAKVVKILGNDQKHYVIEVDVIQSFEDSFAKNDFYPFPSLKDAPNIGPETKNSPNQAIRIIDDSIAKDILRAIFIISPNLKENNDLANLIDGDFRIEKLVSNNDIEKPNHVRNIIKELIIKEFILWTQKVDNYKKSYEGLITNSILHFWDSEYFNDKLFSISSENLMNEYNKIEKLINDKNNILWKKYSDATSNGAPAAILGKENYLKFLKDFIKDENNFKILIQSLQGNRFNFNLIESDLSSLHYKVNSELLKRYISSLLTKPFVILTGLSGSGKTKLAQAFAMWICENESQYKLVPVGADWTNREPLLGFPNALNEIEYVKPDSGVLDLLLSARDNKDKPHFLILDEMNLSHVERYFADFLSVMESEESISLYKGAERKSSDGTVIPSKIEFPDNLFIIGTVNIDETTYMFSPKVLDRANVIEFRVTKDEMKEFFDSGGSVDLSGLTGKGSDQVADFLNLSRKKDLESEYKDEISKVLLNLFDDLQKAGAEFGYRSASEIIRFSALVNRIGPEFEEDDILDAAIMQKLLPKLHGSRKKLVATLDTLGKFCISEGKESFSFSDDKKVRNAEGSVIYPLSFDKLKRMYKNLIDNGFTSFAES